MSEAYLIALGAPGHVDPAKNSAAHVQLLADLNAEAERLLWDGTTIDFYRRHEGWLSIYVTPGDAPATMEDLRQFRDQQRQAEVVEQDQPEQGRLV
ncbi:hypothetical protein [Rhizobium sp. PL01]|uniref:hypothetical protein n=1 Tax=Rhizobium sp. PL01 TaxID=3085631 RepID=UPI0029827ECA|nr:hypothetical protein [Rhizobium sp. PL01]MDW5313753.1 hypothetical protein [Rhizobium sp. PL01]